ncbi:MAG: chloride channel protein, partial [Clostridia bacterium]|nr:chloride channel protein [Clostridia bacterium]
SLIKSKRFSTRDKDEVTSVVAESGVTSALTAIFNAPLAGIAFVIEELEHKISGLLVVALTFGSATSLFTSYSLRKLLDLPERLFALSLPTLPPSYFWAILLLGVILGILATLYVKLIKAFGKPNFLKKIPVVIKLIAVFLITGATGIFLTNVLGGGSFVIRELLSVAFPWWILLVMLVVKSLLTALALSSSSHGGLLMPTLAIGAIAGALLGKMALLLGVPSEYYSLFVIAGALSFFGGVYRAPISAILLTIELTGNAHGIATIGAEIIITFIVAESLLKIPYRRIFDKIKTKKNKSNDIKNNGFLKTPLDTHQN